MLNLSNFARLPNRQKDLNIGWTFTGSFGVVRTWTEPQPPHWMEFDIISMWTPSATEERYKSWKLRRRFTHTLWGPSRRSSSHSGPSLSRQEIDPIKLAYKPCPLDSRFTFSLRSYMLWAYIVGYGPRLPCPSTKFQFVTLTRLGSCGSWAREGRIMDVSWPTTSLKFGAEVTNCIWRFVLCLNKCIWGEN